MNILRSRSVSICEVLLDDARGMFQHVLLPAELWQATSDSRPLL